MNTREKLTKIANERPETRAVIVPVLKQAGNVTYNTAKMAKVLDNFVRFLMGDANTAISSLKTLGNPGVVGLAELVDSDPKTYNDLYKDLYDLFLMAVKRTLK